jgi:hypothetical protein
MAATHGGDMWLDKLISIDIDLIVHITWWRSVPKKDHLNRHRTHCTHHMSIITWHGFRIVPRGQKKDKTLSEEMKKKYDTERGMHGIIIKWISDIVTRMAKKLMACKLLRK